MHYENPVPMHEQVEDEDCTCLICSWNQVFKRKEKKTGRNKQSSKIRKKSHVL